MKVMYRMMYIGLSCHTKHICDKLMEVPLSSTVKMNIWYLQLITCHQSVRLYILLFKHMNKKQATIFSINFIQTKLHMTNYHLELRGT